MKQMSKNAPYVVLIPAYKPDARLVTLVKTLREKDLAVTVVDDGGGEAFAAFFKDCAALGADVVTHAVNQGKGRALKTGINALLNSGKEIAGVVTAAVALNEDGSIASVTLDTACDTAGIGAEVAKNEAFVAQFVGKTGPFALGENVDGVSGATITSTAAVDAINQAIQ